MPDTRRRVVLIAAAAIVLMGLVPPWVQTQAIRAASGAGGVLQERHTYGFLFIPPGPPRPQVDGSPEQLQPFNSKDVARIIRQVVGRKASAWSKDYDLVHEFLALNPSLKNFGVCNIPESFVPLPNTLPAEFLELCGDGVGRIYDLAGFRLPGGGYSPKYGRALLGWQTRLDIARLLVQWALVLTVAAVAFWLRPART